MSTYRWKTKKVGSQPKPPLMAHCAQWANLIGEGGVRGNTHNITVSPLLCCIGQSDIYIYIYIPAPIFVNKQANNMKLIFLLLNRPTGQ